MVTIFPSTGIGANIWRARQLQRNDAWRFLGVQFIEPVWLNSFGQMGAMNRAPAIDSTLRPKQSDGMSGL